MSAEWMQMGTSARGFQKRTSYSLELEFQVVVSCLIWVQSSGTAVSSLNCWAIYLVLETSSVPVVLALSSACLPHRSLTRSTGDWTQGLCRARQVLYRWASAPALLLVLWNSLILSLMRSFHFWMLSNNEYWEHLPFSTQPFHSSKHRMYLSYPSNRLFQYHVFLVC